MTKKIDSHLAKNTKPTGWATVTAPFDGTEIAQVATVGAKEVDAALAAAHALYEDRSQWLTLPQRLTILEKLTTLMAGEQEALALAAAQEGGKPLVDSRVEAARAVEGIKLCIETLRTEQGSVIPMNLTEATSGRMAFTQKEPIGVVVAVSAFNHPLNLIVHQVGAAIAAGCPTLVKPAGDTPLSCIRFVELLYQAGLPREWCQVIIAENRQVSTQLVVDAQVGFFSFIGSAAVGWKLRSQLAPGTRCALEHGGVAPVIVAEDADLDKVIPSLAKGGFYHAGQVCVSVQRIYAEASIVDALAKGLAQAADKLIIGDPTAADTEVGPLIRTSEVDRIDAWVQEAIQGGAQCLAGGKRLSDSTYACTVLLNPPESAKVSLEEVFGPVVCIYAYSELDEAIEKANGLNVSFQSAVFTHDLRNALYCYERLDASAVMINDHTAFRIDGMPFAGLKHSGLGVGGIPHTIADMQIAKMLVINA